MGVVVAAVERGATEVATPTNNFKVHCEANGLHDRLGEWAHPVKAPEVGRCRLTLSISS